MEIAVHCVVLEGTSPGAGIVGHRADADAPNR